MQDTCATFSTGWYLQHPQVAHMTGVSRLSVSPGTESRRADEILGDWPVDQDRWGWPQEGINPAAGLPTVPEGTPQ